MPNRNKNMFSPSRGFTLVELLVAMALSLLIAMAAMAALVLARQGFFSTDATAELRDNGRFATTVIKRLAVQSGYLDNEYAIGKGVNALFDTGSSDAEPNIKGFNNAKFNKNLAIGTTNTVGSGGTGVNSSDMLIIRFQGNKAYLNDASSTESSSAIDQAVIDCFGEALPEPKKSTDLTPNAFYVDNSTSSGEPTLYCARPNPANPAGDWLRSPVIDGVENFQVLYGVDKVNPGNAATGATDSLPERYLRADQLVVAGDLKATNKNWDRVRSIRIGMVLRSRPGTSAPRDADEAKNTLYPLGAAFRSTADSGSTFVTPNDGRFRETVTFTVHLRNSV